MPSNTLKKLAQVTLGATDTLVHTCPPLTREVVVALFVTNTDAADRTFRLHAVDAGGSVALGNALYYDQPLTSKRTLRDAGILLEPGQMLRGLASAASVVVVTVFGIAQSEPG